MSDPHPFRGERPVAPDAPRNPLRGLRLALWIWPFVGLLKLGAALLGGRWSAAGAVLAGAGFVGMFTITRRIDRG